ERWLRHDHLDRCGCTEELPPITPYARNVHRSGHQVGGIEDKLPTRREGIDGRHQAKATPVRGRLLGHSRPTETAAKPGLGTAAFDVKGHPSFRQTLGLPQIWLLPVGKLVPRQAI